MTKERQKVLILDDNLMDVMEAERYLIDGGYDVSRLSSPNGAISKIDFESPDILLLNIYMERLDADDLISTLQGSQDYQELVVVLYSDEEADTLQSYCVEHDLNGYFCKSMDVSGIAEFLDKFFEYE
jgi:PleD family two-component response regulator